MVEPGLTTTVPIGLQLNLVDVEWSVTPVLIEDRYEITVTQTFQTKVPSAVVVVEPGSVTLPYLEPGEVFNGEFKVTNYGLIEAFDIRLEFPAAVNDYEIEVLSEVLPKKLGAMQSVTIPYRITKRAQSSRDDVSSLFNDVEGYGGSSCSDSFVISLKGTCEVCPNSTHSRFAEKVVDFLVSYYEDMFCGKSTDEETEGQFKIIGLTDNPDLAVYEPDRSFSWVGSEGCSYYSDLCESSDDEYACATTDCCESFGDNPVGDCIRGCLIEYDKNECSTKSGSDRDSCRRGVHWKCYLGCGAYITGVCALLETPEECDDAMDIVGW